MYSEYKVYIQDREARFTSDQVQVITAKLDYLFTDTKVFRKNIPHNYTQIYLILDKSAQYNQQSIRDVIAIRLGYDCRDYGRFGIESQGGIIYGAITLFNVSIEECEEAKLYIAFEYITTFGMDALDARGKDLAQYLRMTAKHLGYSEIEYVIETENGCITLYDNEDEGLIWCDIFDENTGKCDISLSKKFLIEGAHRIAQLIREVVKQHESPSSSSSVHLLIHSSIT